MKKSSFVALGIFAVLLAVVLLTREKHVNVGVPKLELPAIDKAKVTSIEASGPRAAILSREGQGWVVADPKKPEVKHAADEDHVRAALDALVELRARDFVTERPEKHAEYELDEAKGLKVKVSMEGVALLELVFGKGAKGGGVYLREAKGNAVFVTPSGFPWQVRKDAGGWRRRVVTTAKAEEISKLSIALADGSKLSLQQGEGSAWTAGPETPLPAGFRFDPEAAGRLAQQFSSLNALDFADGLSEEALGLSGPHSVVEASLKDGRVVKLHLGTAPDSQELGRAQALKGQFGPIDEAGGEKDGKLSRADLEKAAGDGERPEDVRKAARKLADEAALFASYDVGMFAGRANDGAIDEEDLTSVIRTAGTVPAKLEGDPQLYLLPSWGAAELRKRLEDLRDLTLMSFDVSKATKLVISASGKRTAAAKEGGAWKLVEPKTLPSGFEFDPGQVDAQMQALRSVRALRALADAKDAQAGLAKPSATVEVSLEGGGSQVFRIGAELTGPTGGKEVYAKGSADGLVYAMDPYFKTRLETGVELFRKPPPPPDMSQIRGLEGLPPDVRRQLEAQLNQRRGVASP
ncbi:MAG: DUF4340 domain-containing protein [Myxococcales bacterium]|nr:DUF4340 domain-containing protein [Myxococcales bacterium]